MSSIEVAKGLEFSIPANNKKIIEIYNQLRSGLLAVNKDYQRKLVWKRSHKLNFIDTILRNYPFPEIYLAPGALDQVKLILIDEIVDGQQRLTTIRDYIEGTDVFALPNISVKKFNELTPDEKSMFLNYEVSVRYLKNVSKEQIREIFQRINKTDYALNATERVNAQWGDSEFVCFAKQLIEPEFESDSVQFRIGENLRKKFIEFFHGEEEEDGVFTANDISRMLALQYIMSLVATMDSQEYFSRNDKIHSYIEGYNESFPQAAELRDRLSNIVDFIQGLPVKRDSRWYNKANLFTLFVELDKCNLPSIDSQKFGSILHDLDVRATLDEIEVWPDADKELTSDELKYLNYAREAVNQKSAREFRGEFMRQLINKSIKHE